MRGVGPLMDFNGIAIGILFCWFLAGLYALKQGAKVLKAYKSCLPYYNLAAVFLGPVALVFCGAVEYGGRFLAGFTAKKASGNRKEIPLTIIDEKGNDKYVLGEINCSCVGFTSHLELADEVAQNIINIVSKAKN